MAPYLPPQGLEPETRGVDVTCIAVASRKGGVGKTTTAIALSFMFARKGYQVGVLELDENAPIQDLVDIHRSRGRDEANLTLIDQPPRDEKLKQTIKRLKKEHEVVVIDLPGAATSEMLVATAAAELVLIPMRTARWDGDQANRTYHEIVDMNDDVRNPPIVRLVLTQTPAGAVLPRAYHRNIKAIEREKLPRMRIELAQRKEWIDIQEGGAYPAEGSKAYQNAEALFEEVVDLLAEDDDATAQDATNREEMAQ